jgi:arylsulfatase A-like enzyme
MASTGVDGARSDGRSRRAPNVVIVLLDDVGFAQFGCFGSEIETPNIDALAAGGLRYNRFHVTALCSPTRAAMLTGRNHHRVGMGFLPDIPLTFPGYDGKIPAHSAPLPRILRGAGYNTFAIGKWHLAPRWELSASGPFDRWPLGMGFERYYGFLAGDTNQWSPNLTRDNAHIDPPRRPEEGYHLTEDLVDHAVQAIVDQHNATPDKPFFLYFAPGAGHAPHHVAPEWSARYAGRFDGGWERLRERTFARQVEMGVVPRSTTLTPRPSWVDDWDALPADERRFKARTHEVFAGFMTHTDHQIGRLVTLLRELGELDNTVFMVTSDNGASAEGGPSGSVNEQRFAFGYPDDLAENIARMDELGGHRAYNHYAWGWAWAGNTPFKLWKRYAWLGGTRTPLVVHWPDGFGARGEVRDQFCHAIDVLPTVLDATGVVAPKVVDGADQSAIDGASLLATFGDGAAASPRDTQYFEVIGSRSIYHDGWKAVTDHVSEGVSAERERIPGSHDLDADTWHLYDVAADFAESNDLAEAEPGRLGALVERWWFEAGRNQVLPLIDNLHSRGAFMDRGPYPARTQLVFRPGGNPVAEELVPPMVGGMDIVVVLGEPVDGHEGLLCAQGDWTNGWAFYVLGGVLTFVFNAFGTPTRVTSDVPVADGAVRLEARYRPSRPGGDVELFVDGAQVGDGRLPEDMPFRWQIGGAGLVIGEDGGFPVCDDYEVPFRWTGTISTVTLTLPRHVPVRKLEDELEHVLRHE